MISFKPLTYLKNGDIFNTLVEIYSAYKEINHDLYLEWSKNWREYDDLIFNNPKTVGNAGFITLFNDKFSGFCSWDPRNGPDKIIVGHNGVLPDYRGKGIGVVQINEMLKRFKTYNFHSVFVSTGVDKFFEPAQKMYLRCGFKEINRRTINNHPNIEYRIDL